MSKKITRLSALLVSLVLLLTLFSACGKSNEANDTSTAKTVEASKDSTPAPEPLKEVTLRFFFPGDKPQACEQVWEQVSSATKDTLNAKFEINFVPFSDYPDKLQLLTASGDQYDMHFDADWFVYPKLVNKGALLPLNDLLPKYAPNLYKQYEKLNYLTPCSVEGKLYGIPWTDRSTGRPAVLYRKDLLKKYGMESNKLETIEDLDTYLYAVKKNDPKLVPTFWMQTDPGSAMWPLYAKYEYDRWDFHQLTINLNDPQHKVVPIEQTEMFKEAVQYAYKWHKDGITPKDMMASENKGLSMYDGTIGAQVHIFDNVANGVIAGTKFPTVEGAEAGYSVMYPDKKYKMNSPMNNAVVLNKNAANPERTLMFLELFSDSQEIYDLVIYGIQGTTYKLDGDQVAFPDGMDPTKPNYLNWPGQWGLWRENLTRPDATRTKAYWDENKKFLDFPSNVISPITGLTPNTDSIKTEIAKRDALYEELGKLLAFGMVKDVDKSLNEYIEKQKQAGLDKIIAEVQKQVDAWTSAK